MFSAHPKLKFASLNTKTNHFRFLKKSEKNHTHIEKYGEKYGIGFRKVIFDP